MPARRGVAILLGRDVLHPEGHLPLFTPQRLFGEEYSAANLVRHTAFLERARLEQEQGNEVPSRLALTAYLIARLLDRLPLPSARDPDTGYRWQLEAIRRHANDLPPDLPESAHLAGIVETLPPSGQPLAGLRVTLTAYAYFLEHEARLEEALDVLALVAQCHGSSMPAAEFAALALFTARLNRLLARWETAAICYHAAEDAGRELGDPVAALRGRLGRGAVHRGEGNLPLARTIAQAVVDEATRLGLPEVQALAYADLGVALQLQGMGVSGLEALFQAFMRTPDSVQRMRTLGDLGIGLIEIGAFDEARLAFEIVLDAQTSFLVRTNALLELMHLESAAGNRVAFERRRAAADDVETRMTPSMAVDFHYKSGIGLARFGQIARARDQLRAGLRLAEDHRLNSWYFRLDAVLKNLDGCSADVSPRWTEGTPGSEEAVRRMADGLRQYAAQAAG